MSIRVSVVVPTYKRPALLVRCLEALLHQDFPPDAYEIIIVDDAACAETRTLVENFPWKIDSFSAHPEAILRSPGIPDLKYIPAIATQGPAAARNLGWKHARGNIIAFTDDDCLPRHDWLRQGVLAFKDGIDGVSGQVVVPIPDTPTDYEKNAAQLAHSRFVTANCFYRRCVLETCGGFDERFALAWREDTDLHFKLLEHSCGLVDAPLAVVVHPIRPAPWGVSLHQQRKAMYNALLYKKYPTLYQKHVQAAPPYRYYLILSALISLLAALLAANRQALTFALLLWLALTLHFAFQRLSQTKKSTSHVLEMLFTSALIPPLSVFWRLFGAFTYKVLFF